jgi:hypothetical protein
VHGLRAQSHQSEAQCIDGQTQAPGRLTSPFHQRLKHRDSSPVDFDSLEFNFYHVKILLQTGFALTYQRIGFL